MRCVLVLPISFSSKLFQGDSGSPLNDLKNERWEVAGILKGGSTVHDKRIKGFDSTYKLFESVVFHKEWMKRTVKELEDKYDASTPTGESFFSCVLVSVLKIALIHYCVLSSTVLQMRDFLL